MKDYITIVMIKDGITIDTVCISHKQWLEIDTIDYIDLNELKETDDCYGVTKTNKMLALFNNHNI